MYINPFLAGVLSTLMVEIIVAFVAAISAAIRRVNDGN